MKQQILQWSIFAVLLLTVFGGDLPARDQTPPLAVLDFKVADLDYAVERKLSPREEHHYRLTLKKGECASVIVEQRGIDVVVHVRAADGQLIADFQDDVKPRGSERVNVVADADGEYTLAITPAKGVIASGPYRLELLDRRQATDDDRSMQEARHLRTSAGKLQDQSQFDAARALLERALAITEEARGPEDAQVAAVCAQLAALYLLVPDNTRAEAYSLRALAIMDKTVGSDQPAPALVRARLALAYQRMGQRSKAEPLLRQALDVIERTLGSEHPWVVRCLVTLGTLRNEADDLDEAETVDRRALAIMDTIGDHDSLTYAGVLNNLAAVYRQKQDYQRAEDLFRQSLAVSEKLRGPESLPVARTLSNLGLMATTRKDYATAESYYARALAIRERIEGPDHPDVAIVLNNIALLHHLTGDDHQALQTHLRALRISENQRGGPYQPSTLLSVGNIAQTYLTVGDLPNAIEFQRRADAIIEGQLALNLAVGSEKQKLAFVKGIAERTDRTISLHLREAPGNSRASALAALVILQRKGRVQDAMTDTFATVRQRVTDAADRALLDQLKTTTSQLARTVLTTDDAGRRAADRQRAIADLEARKDQLEAALSEHSAAFRTEMRTVTLEGVQAAMSDGAALLEFAVFRPFDPRAESNGGYGVPHYAAYVLHNHGAPQGRDLGPTATIDRAVELLRASLRDPQRDDLKARARAVDSLVTEPLRALIGGATHLLISPDGALNLIPFEALVDDEGQYLIEHYAMSYLTSGRDLLRLQTSRVPHSGPVIIANPLFGEPQTTIARQAMKQVPRTRGLRSSVTTGDDLSSIYFSPLTITAEEGRAIKALFPEATLLTGNRATKAALERLDAPLLLHIASHGFFLSDAAGDARAASSSSYGTRTVSTSVRIENPLLRSGLALAGANLTRESNEGGILTAMEASGLNLWGTKLVTLSACDTGIGEVRNGEGVYGLRHAFLLAGAETLVMSLWPVSDYMTREMMVPFYTGLRAGLGRSEALRQAQLAMLKRKGREHPFFWAGFIQSGDWATLDGRR
ncbi:MAG TPA: CHAT domain-containing tetratricopeptide repeat protein [Vicinamibacterales bacterium]|jgi:CHAT domain-containing protein/Tfp pilus assembly protein PilF|nr:CHAT domain-containing tetratricopeptide repeat protein [Vicinamibacterales bacterium]